jgi:hypothetical protein
MTRFKILSINKLGQATEMDDLGRSWHSILEALEDLVNNEGWQVSFTLTWPDSTDLYLTRKVWVARPTNPNIVIKE